jgi:hypothetical protein
MSTEEVDTTDYLDVDKPLPGQNYACLSFVCPEEIIKKKEDFYFNSYLEQLSQEQNFVERERYYFRIFCEKLQKKYKIVNDDKDETSGELNIFNDYLKYIDDESDELNSLYKNENFTVNNFCDKYDLYLSQNKVVLNEKFDTLHKFRTSVRGIKIRGVFATLKEAEIRAKVLQKLDKNFHVYVAQVGYWLPFDPSVDQIENVEYAENDLNKLVKAYKENETKKEVFFNEQTREKVNEISTLERQKREEAKKAKEAEVSTSSGKPDNEGQNIINELEKADPWLATKTK